MIIIFLISKCYPRSIEFSWQCNISTCKTTTFPNLENFGSVGWCNTSPIIDQSKRHVQLFTLDISQQIKQRQRLTLLNRFIAHL